jgi:hypothetical protein
MVEKDKYKTSLMARQPFLIFTMGLCVIGCLLMAAPINVRAEAGKPVWAPAGSLPEGFDWIQLTSGEWLKGDLKVLYADSLEFDSDELDLLKFDWADVHQVITHEPQSIRIENPEAQNSRVWNMGGLADTVKGILHIEGDRVIIHTDEGTKEFDRSYLVSIAPGTERELDYWSAQLTLSLDVSQGNSEQLNYSTYAEVKRRTALSRFFADYRGIYATTYGTVTANSQRASSYYDIFSTRQFFWRPVIIDYFRDTFANIDHRTSLGAGLGYTLIDTAKTEWIVSPGIAYQGTRYDSVEPGEDEFVSTPAFLFSTQLDTDITKTIDFIVKYNFNVVNKESGTYSHNASAALEFELTSHLDFDLSVVWDRIQDPQPDSEGIVPEQDDFYFFFGISFEL